MKRLFSILLILSACSPKTIPFEKLSISSESAGFKPNLQNTYSRAITAKDKSLADSRFPSSQYLNPIPQLDKPKPISKVRIIAPGAYKNWQEAGINDPKIKEFWITPGDFRYMGVFSPVRSGKSIVVRYYNIEDQQPHFPEHPVKQAKKAILAGFRLEGVDNWVLHGLTFENSNNRIYESKSITIDYCYVLNSTQYGVRIVNSENIYIQNSVFEQTDLDLIRDGGAIAVSATKNRFSTAYIINNEIRDFPDGIGAPRESSTYTGLSAMTGDVKLIVDNNDIYITPAMYIYKDGQVFSRSENSMDYKNGSGTISNNRIFGYRASNNDFVSGSSGVTAIFHRNAHDYIFENNLIFDSTIGVTIASDDRKFPLEHVRNIQLINNLISVAKYDLSPASGYGVHLGNGGIIANNSVTGLGGYWVLNQNQQSVFSCNTLNAPGLYTFHVKRWTGVEAVTVPGISNAACYGGGWQ